MPDPIPEPMLVGSDDMPDATPACTDDAADDTDVGRLAMPEETPDEIDVRRDSSFSCAAAAANPRSVSSRMIFICASTCQHDTRRHKPRSEGPLSSRALAGWG